MEESTGVGEDDRPGDVGLQVLASPSLVSAIASAAIEEEACMRSQEELLGCGLCDEWFPGVRAKRLRRVPETESGAVWSP